MLLQTLETAQATAQQELLTHLQAQAKAVAPETEDAKTFWDNLAWEVECFPERFSLQEQHIQAGLDPADLQHLSEEPRLKGRPTQVFANGRYYSID